MTRLVAVSSGSAAETRTFSDHHEQLADVLYTGDAADLRGADAVWVPEGTPRRRLAALAPGLDAVLARGGAVLLFGDHQGGWPATARWSYRPAGGAGDTVLGDGFEGAVGAAAQQLHHHGVLDPPAGADVLLATSDGAAVAYLDCATTAGVMFVSTIDPLAHYGHTTDPAARHFLGTFLSWVTDALLPGGHR